MCLCLCLCLHLCLCLCLCVQEVFLAQPLLTGVSVRQGAAAEPDAMDVDGVVDQVGFWVYRTGFSRVQECGSWGGGHVTGRTAVRPAWAGAWPETCGYTASGVQYCL